MRTWNVCDYGACFSDRLQTEKIQKAIDDCFLAGGGRVLIPCGVYLTGGIRLRSRVELHLESGAILKGSRDPEDYFGWREDALEPVSVEEYERHSDATTKKNASCVPSSRWCNGLIRAIDAEDIAVTGEKGSYIDGSLCYDPQGENNYRGPHGMSLWRCKNIKLEGYTFINSSNWCHAIFQSQDITMKNVSVYGGFDGFDVRTCDNVRLEDCKFYTGDDCVAGFDNNDVVVKNCLLNTACMPLRFGGSNVLVENCVSDERRFGSRLRLTLDEKIRGEQTNPSVRHASWTAFAYYCDHRADPRRTPGNIVFRHCRFDQERELVRLEFDGRHRWCCNRSLRSVSFENCSFGGLVYPGMMWGDAKEKVTCVFKNCVIRRKPEVEECEKPVLVAGNFEKLVFEDCRFEGFDDATVLVGTDDEADVIRSGPLTVRRATQEECFAAHTTGVASQDAGKDLTFW